MPSEVSEEDAEASFAGQLHSELDRQGVSISELARRLAVGGKSVVGQRRLIQKWLADDPDERTEPTDWKRAEVEHALDLEPGHFTPRQPPAARPGHADRLEEVAAAVAQIRQELLHRNEIAADMADVAKKNQRAIRSHDKALRDVVRRLASLEAALAVQPAENHLP